jgi:hypothetical protein
MPKLLRQALAEGRYSFDDLRALPRTREYEITKSTDTRILIYNILLKGINGQEGNNRLYTGKTVDAGSRFQSHSDGLSWDSDMAGQMYVYGRLAREYKMIVWTDLSKVPSTRRNKTLRAAEFTSVALNFSWCPAVLEGGDSWLFDRLAARIMSRRAENVFAVTGWEPPKGCQGANWQTPLMDADYKYTAWTCVKVPLENGHSISVYRRGGCSRPREAKQHTNQRYSTCLRVELIDVDKSSSATLTCQKQGRGFFQLWRSTTERTKDIQYHSHEPQNQVQPLTGRILTELVKYFSRGPQKPMY